MPAPAVEPTSKVELRRAPGCTIEPLRDQNVRMKAVEWHGKRDMRVAQRGKPMITDPHDVVIKITASAICGSDLHLYHGYFPGMQKGDVMGHEFMGIVEAVGPQVKDRRIGDRVVVCFDIGCPSCVFCTKHKLYSSCDNTNDSKAMEKLYGDRSSGMFGYSHMTGGWDGGQAQYVRVPFADVNTIKVPDSLSDLKVLFLSDIMPTGWHGAEMGQVSEGQTVAIWGCGPVGQLAAVSCHIKKASRIILIDEEQYRLDFAKKHLPYVETILSSTSEPVYDQLRRLIPEGPDVGIECVGVHYTKSILHKVELAVMLETDPCDVLNEMIKCVRKGGIISIIGAYAAATNGYMIGAFMEKGMRMAGGQCPVQKYWPTLLPLIEKGELDPSFVITHEVPIDKAPEMYKIFDEKKEGVIKVVLRPHAV
ncbi:hypothetical protein HK104_009760 [Borealophlyctis nickersoniae]|nr:hypothetical protein HK104_009760 [Borealophlyctis nickersoniae]